MPHQCPSYNSTHLIPIKLNTKQLKQTLTPLFPNMPISHINHNTTNHKKTLKQQLTKIHHNNTQILINTQMLTKNHHFPNITLITLLNINNTLFSTNFHSTKHFTQLYTQITNHAKHTNKQNKIMLQTHHPKHPLLQTLLYKNYNTFTKQTLTKQQIIQLPP